MDLLKVSGISRNEDGLPVLQDIHFSQQAFQKLAIAGATGSGKTTLLKMIAGLVQPTTGEVLFEGQKIKGPEEKLIPGHPSIAYLSQHFELRNHYRVEEILQMASRLSGEEVENICAVCRIDHLLKRWTHQLSGGERQRIALARLLVSAPSFLLLDEPYSNLDALHRNILRLVIAEISEKMDITCMIVSHDPVDVLSWADEIIILQDGKMVQKASPEEVYNQPVNEYAAALFGKFNVMSPFLAKAFSAFTDIELNYISSFIRPEQFQIGYDENSGVKGEVQKVLFMGSYYEAEVNISGNAIIIYTNNSTIKKGESVYVSFNVCQEKQRET